METITVFETRKSLVGTLRKMPVNGQMVIKTVDFKAAQVRSVASTLKRNEGYEFSVSDAGRIDEVVIIRFK
jgi:hypothetical protein